MFRDVNDRSSSSTPFVPKKPFSFSPSLSAEAPLPELSKRFLNPAAPLSQMDSRMVAKPVERVNAKPVERVNAKPVAKASVKPVATTTKPTLSTVTPPHELTQTPHARTEEPPHTPPFTPPHSATTPLPYAMPALTLPATSHPPPANPDEMPRIRSIHLLQPAEQTPSTATDRAALLFAMILHSHFMRATFAELQFLFRILSCGVAFDYDSPRAQTDLPAWRALSRRGAAFTLPQHCFRFCLLVLESLQDLLVSLPVASSTPTYL